MPTFDVDLHAHTRFFHHWPASTTHYDPVGALLLGNAGRYRGLDGVALTNHDYYRLYDTDGVVALPGIEVSTTAGHVVVVGPDPPQRTQPNALEPGEVVEMAHQRDCAAILPHPYRRGDLRQSGLAFDAVEINGKRPQSADLVRSLAERLDLPIVGGSDAHLPVEVGRAFTRVRAPELSPEAVVDAIRDGRVEPVVAETRLHRALRSLYARIHEWKGHVETVADEATPTSVGQDDSAPGAGREDGSGAEGVSRDGTVRDETSSDGTVRDEPGSDVTTRDDSSGGDTRSDVTVRDETGGGARSGDGTSSDDAARGRTSRQE